MIFKNVKQAMQDYRDTVINEKEKFLKTEKELTEKYTMNYCYSEIAKAKEEYEESVRKSRLEVFKVLNETLAELRDKIKSVASEPIDPDFIPTLTALSKIESPSKEEIDTIVGKFKHNYVCYRAICDVVGGAVNGYSPVRIEDVLKKVKFVEDKVKRAMDDDVNFYGFRMVCDSVILDNASDYFESFFGGSFDKIVEESEREKQDKNFVE